MELADFRTDLMNEARTRANQNGTSAEEEYVNMYTDQMQESEEISGFNALYYQGVDKHKGIMRIDGFNYDELDDCLEIFVCPVTNSQKMESLSQTDADKFFKQGVRFIKASLDEYIQNNSEESSPGFGLAYDIKHRYSVNLQKIRIYIITDAVMSNRISEIPSSKINGVPTEYHIFDISRYQALNESVDGKEEIIIELKDFGLKDGVPCLKASENEEYTAYLCNIPGIVLANLYNKFGGRLLEGNVRSFLTARGKVNKGIRNTILNEPAMFFAYNNGIAATAYDVEIKNKAGGAHITKIRSLQIVNGGQTTASLAAAIINDKARANGLKNIYVPMKLSVVSPEMALQLIPNIAKYANSQNKVSEADFFSNSPFHVQMEKISRRLLAPAVNGNQFGTHWFYERARGQYNQSMAKMTKAEAKRFKMENPTRQKFTKTDLAKYYNIYLMMPDQVNLGAQKNFVKFAEWASKEWDSHPDDFNEAYFKKLVSIKILFDCVDDIVKHASWYSQGYKSQINIYTLSWFFYLLHEQYPGSDLDFKKIWNTQSVSDKVKSILEDLSERVYNYLTDDDRPVVNVTEFAKRKDCWEKLKTIRVKLDSQIRTELVGEDRVKEEKKAAKLQQKTDNSIDVMKQVWEYSVDSWQKAFDFGKQYNLLSPKESSILSSCIKILRRNGFPSEKQCAVMMNILEKLREESFPG